jgi:hypothetical protein
MVCTVCSTRNNYFHSYCYNCGAKLNQSEHHLPNGHARLADGILLNKRRETFNPYKERKKVKKTLQYSMVISILILIGMVYWLMLK